MAAKPAAAKPVMKKTTKSMSNAMQKPAAKPVMKKTTKSMKKAMKKTMKSMKRPDPWLRLKTGGHLEQATNGVFVLLFRFVCFFLGGVNLWIILSVFKP